VTPVTACLFGTYDREHSANRLLRQALAGAGFAVTELHEPLWEERGSKDDRYFGTPSLARLGARWTGAARRLVRRWRLLGGAPPLVVVGFGGQLDLLLAAALCRPRAGLLFAPLVSLTETLVEDRGVFTPGGMRARGVAALDRATLRTADLVLADTAAHAAYLCELGARAERVAVWYLGAEPEFLSPPAPAPTARRVLFYGRYLPLHGIETIVAAAARLGDRVDVVLLGAGPERRRIEAEARRSGARIGWQDPVPLAALPAELSRAAVVLGVFGASRKAGMVVPNKVYQAATAGRPLVTRDGPGLREVLEPGVHCLTCPPGDPTALAEAIARLLDDPVLAVRLGRAARGRMLERFTPERQAARLAGVLHDRLGIVLPTAPPRRLAGC
jgi:glycosyltransferase involved in cell wall biosynthesis